MPSPIQSKGDQSRNIDILNSAHLEGFSAENNKVPDRKELEAQLANPNISYEQAKAIRLYLQNLELEQSEVIPKGELGSKSAVTRAENIVDSKDMAPREILAGMVNMDDNFNPFNLTQEIEKLRDQHKQNNN